jgi:glutamine amidotransferase
VRRATQGKNTVFNCHPFQYGRWVFAHNGDIPGFESHRDELVSEIAPRLRRYVLGDTDSEAVFYVFLTQLQQHGPLGRRHSIDDVVAAVRSTVARVREICDGPDAESKSLLTLIVTDGDTMAATRGGKELYWSTYKTRCADRETCPSLSPECEAPSKTGFVNHLIFSSEPLQGENIWEELEDGDVIGVDWRMRVSMTRLDRVPLKVLSA